MARSKLDKLQDLLLTHKNIGLDSMVFIYHFADHPVHGPSTQIIFDLIEKRKTRGHTSIISVIETLVKPEKEHEMDLVQQYEKIFLNFPNLNVVASDWIVARLTTKLRAIYPKIRIPDCLQIATTILQDCTIFITNDAQLKQIKEIKVLLLDEYV